MNEFYTTATDRLSSVLVPPNPFAANQANRPCHSIVPVNGRILATTAPAVDQTIHDNLLSAFPATFRVV